jgi:hypothetical protein
MPEIYATESFGTAEGVNKAVNSIKAKRGVCHLATAREGVVLRR